MSIAEVVATGAFEPTTDPAALVQTHEWLRNLSGADLEHHLYRAITGKELCAAEVRGPSGSGKSSCIMRVVGDVAKLEGPPAYEMLLLRAGDARDILASPAAFAHYLIDLIRSQGFRFAARVQEELSRVGASGTTATDSITTHTASIEGDATIVRAKYQGALQKAYEQRTYGRNPPQSRQELEDILRIIREPGVRPVVIIDDTDKFADPAPDGLDEEAVDGLFANGVPVLSELKIDYVIAVHPRFKGVGGYDASARKYLRTRLDIPWLDLQRRPISAILARHLQAKGITSEPDELLTEVAQTALWGVYSAAQSLRDTLDTAQRAAQNAENRRSTVIDDEDVNAALQARSAS